jgi:hypothetical protein
MIYNQQFGSTFSNNKHNYKQNYGKHVDYLPAAVSFWQLWQVLFDLNYLTSQEQYNAVQFGDLVSVNISNMPNDLLVHTCIPQDDLLDLCALIA